MTNSIENEESPTTVEPTTQTKTTYQQALDEVSEMQAEIKRLRPAMNMADELCRLFPDLQGRAFNSLSTGRIGITFEGFKDLKQITPVATMLVKNGFHATGFYDDEKGKFRCYQYGRNGAAEIVIYAELVKDGASCRFEKVGVKEVPIYEIVCDGKAVVA